MKQSFNSDLMGVGKFPERNEHGIWDDQDRHGQQGYGKWHGMMMSQDNETIVRKGSRHYKRNQGMVKGNMVITFMTTSEKYAWTNSIIEVKDIDPLLFHLFSQV